MNKSQHYLLDDLQKNQTGIHACTDITGFGLIGHLSEMLGTNSNLTLHLNGSEIPVYEGALRLSEKGIASTLAPQNRLAWKTLNRRIRLEGNESLLLHEVLVDPQTCGPILVACEGEVAKKMIEEKEWTKIGTVK